MINKIRLGAHQRIHPQPYTVDRTNLFTGRVELHVEEDWNSPNASLMSLDAGRSISGEAGIGNLASGGNTGPACVGVERRYDTNNSLAIYTYTYEGIATQHSTKFCEFELDFTVEQNAIETHPNFKGLNHDYGPYDTLNRIWPQYITAQSSATGLKAKSTDTGAVLNPMRGISSYYIPGLTYRISYTDIEVDPDLLDHIGTIVDPPKLGDAFPELGDILSHFGGNRDWLKMSPKIRQRGSCVAITEEYMLSGYTGWVEDVYSEAALQGRTL